MPQRGVMTQTDAVAVATRVRRGTTSLDVVALCDFILARLPALALPSLAQVDTEIARRADCAECERRRKQTAARVKRARGKK